MIAQELPHGGVIVDDEYARPHAVPNLLVTTLPDRNEPQMRTT
jgi:hypothetical protein